MFVVDIRDQDNHEAIPGVRLGDCGHKEACDHVDNGWVVFEDYRVPYDCLLDRFASITEDGEY